MDYIGRALVADALAAWREQLRLTGAPSPLRDLSSARASVLDIDAAHPSGLAQLFAGRATAVTSLFRDAAAQAGALHRARLMCDAEEASRRATGRSVAAMVVGAARWRDGDREWNMPILMRPLTVERERDVDVRITLHDQSSLNPAFVSELRARDADEAIIALAAGASVGASFDPRPVWEAVRALAPSFGGTLEVDESVVLGAFDDPEQHLMGDVEECAHLISSSRVLAALAGDQQARASIAAPLPAPPPGERDPFGERGLGDLDDAQFALLDHAATGRSIFVEAPAGADAIGTAAAIVADSAASGRPAAVVAGTALQAAAVGRVLADLGADQLDVSGHGDDWNRRARARLLESMTETSDPVDEARLRALGEELLSARQRLAGLYSALHEVAPAWDASPYEAVQQVARLTSGDDAPSTTVRLGDADIAYVREVGIDSAAEAFGRAYVALERLRLEREQEQRERAAAPLQRPASAVTDAPAPEAPAAPEPAEEPAPASVTEPASEPEPVREPEPQPAPAASPLAEPTPPPPAPAPVQAHAPRWWSRVEKDATKGAELDRSLAALLLDELPATRADAQEAVAEIGVDAPPTFAAWGDLLDLLDRLRTCLDVFRPEVFSANLGELIAATAPPSPGAAGDRRERRAAVRRAALLLRPGRTDELIFEQLRAAQALWHRWLRHCSTGAPPRVPDDLDGYGERFRAAAQSWLRVAPAVHYLTGTRSLADERWGAFVATLEQLAAGSGAEPPAPARASAGAQSVAAASTPQPEPEPASETEPLPPAQPEPEPEPDPAPEPDRASPPAPADTLTNLAPPASGPIDVLPPPESALPWSPDREPPVERVDDPTTTLALPVAAFASLADDLRDRGVDPDGAARELELAWWLTALDAMLARAPELAEPGVIGATVDEFRRSDAQFGRARVSPLTRAVGERRRVAIARHQDDARDLFAELVEGGDRPYRSVWEQFSGLVPALRPVTLCAADQVAHLLPAERVLGTVVVLGAESLELAHLVPALARAEQVVVIGDSRAATTTALRELAAALPHSALPAYPRPRDPRLSAMLTRHGYADAGAAVPAPGSLGALTASYLDARGTPVAGADVVESTRAEVASVVAEVTRALDSVPRPSVAVVAGNPLHAARIEEALEPRVAGRRDAVPVVPLGRAGGLAADKVILTTGYAPDNAGDPPEELGVLSSELGKRAALQALTATWRDLSVVTALNPTEWGILARTADAAGGVQLVADLLASAALPAPEPVGTGQDYVMADVAALLRREGVAVQVGYSVGGDQIALVAGGRRDRGYSVAVVTDAAPPRPDRTLRDHVRHSHGALEALGWTVVPLWTIDVFADPEAAARVVASAVGAEPRPPSEPMAVTTEGAPPMTDDTAAPESAAPAATAPGTAAPEPAAQPLQRRDASAPATDDTGSVLPRRSADDSDEGWGRGDSWSRDADLMRDRPPHWGSD